MENQQSVIISRSSVRRLRLLTALMVLSGIAGISYEIIYGRILGNLIGDQFAVSASILITFLLGIGLGAMYAHRLWRHLWAIELGIGVCGALFALGSGLLDTVLYTVWLPGMIGSLVLCMALLITPAFLIGCSIPLFSGYLSREMEGAVFAQVYSIYNIGAALSAMAIEFYLLRHLGLQGTTLFFAAINALIAGTLLLAFSDIREQPPVKSEHVFGWSRSEWLALAVASVSSAVFQLFMIKIAEMILGPFRETFALVLTVVLLGIALGSAWVKKHQTPFSHVMVVNLIGLLFLFPGVQMATSLYAQLYAYPDSYSGSVSLKFLFVAGLMAVPSLTYGATIPALLTRRGDVSREAGELLWISSLSNAFGFLLMVFGLHSQLDYGVQLLVIVAFSSVALWIYDGLDKNKIGFVVAFLIGCFGLKGVTWDEDMLYLSYSNFHSVRSMERARADFQFPERFRGHQDVFSISWSKGRPFFYINGYISIPLNNPSEKVVGALGSIFSPRSDDALVLGLGSGATGSAVGLLFDHTDIVEINPVVRENLYRMKQWNFDIESNPKVNIIVDDGIHYSKVVEKQYSLILNTVTTPLYFSSSKLYTVDFFEVIKKRLKPDGIYLTWVDGRIGDKGIDIVLNSLKQSFKHASLVYVKSGYFLLICSDEPVEAHQPMIAANNPTLANYLLAEHGIYAKWLPYQLVSSDAFSLISETDAPINRLDTPELEFEMAHLRKSNIRGFITRLFKQVDLARIESEAHVSSEVFPYDLLAHLRERLGKRKFWKAYTAKLNNFRVAKVNRAARVVLESRVALAPQPKQVARLIKEQMKAKRYERALENTYVLEQISPEYLDLFFQRAVCFYRLGRLDESVESFLSDRRSDPSDQDIAPWLGRVYVEQQNWKAALPELKRATRLDGASWHSYSRLGQTYEALGMPLKATTAYHEALGLSGRKADVYRRLRALESRSSKR